MGSLRAACSEECARYERMQLVRASVLLEDAPSVHEEGLQLLSNTPLLLLVLLHCTFRRLCSLAARVALLGLIVVIALNHQTLAQGNGELQVLVLREI